MDIGTIIEMSKSDNGDIECRVDFGSGDECTASFGQRVNGIEYPMIDDEVAVERIGAENIIVASFPAVNGVTTGESVQYGRDSSGDIVSTVKCSSDGTVSINGGNDFVALSSKVDDLWSSLDSVFRNWAVAPQDGGAALKTAYIKSFVAPPGSVASNCLKAE